MAQKKSATTAPETAWEQSIDWNHPLVKAGLVPGHLLRETFGYEQNGWSEWVNEHEPRVTFIRRFKRRPWFHLESFVAWVAKPENAKELPPT